jgi:hypothetical protein
VAVACAQMLLAAAFLTSALGASLIGGLGVLLPRVAVDA